MKIINEAIIDKALFLGESFDLGKKEYLINKKRYVFYFLSSLCDQQNILLVMQTVLSLNDINKIGNYQLKRVENLEEFQTDVLSGLVGIYSNGNYGYIMDVRSYPGREPNEPDTERVVRGARDGFTESIIKNCGLIRRRIRTPYLINEIIKVGYDSKTDVSITYIKNLVDNDLLNDIRKRLDMINTKEIVMADKAIEELIVDNKWNPYPFVRYTERPDTLASHLYHGKIALLVDNSPSVIMLPTTFFDHLEHAEEFRQRPFIGSFLKIMRLIGVFISMFLMPLWVLYAVNPDITSSYFASSADKGSIPLISQIIIAEIGIEFLRMAAIHTPTPLSNAMGLLSGILIGEIAINVGFFSKEIILYTAISQMGSYATPSYELALANKIFKIFFIILTYWFNIYGLVLGIILWIIILATSKSFKTPYLYPLIPFNLKKFVKIFIRFPHKK